jgi:hypothetical protein
VKNEQQEANGWAPALVADLRAVPLGELLLDSDGAAADLRNKILPRDGREERLPVAAFQASI